MTARALFPAALWSALTLLLAFLTLPIAAVFLDVGPGEIGRALAGPGAIDALRLSLITTLSALALIVVCGTPAAYLLATRSFKGRSLAITLIELPLVLPPAVAGIGLLAALGPKGLIGPWLVAADIELVFQTAGVVVALTFVASPFYVRQALAAFEAVDPVLLDASSTLGAGPALSFVRVAIPNASGGLFSGVALAWGRALGEFGATLVFAGSFRGITQTAPLAIVERVGSDYPGALALSAVLVVVSLGLLLTVKVVSGSFLPGVR